MKKYLAYLAIPILGVLAWLMLKGKGQAIATTTSPAAPGTATTAGSTLAEKAWQVHYSGSNSGMGRGDALKRWPLPGQSLVDAIPANLAASEPRGRITIPDDKATGLQMGKGRWYRPDGFRLSNSAGESVGSLTGDPRALYCLDILITRAGITGLRTYGMQVTQGPGGDLTHDYGYAIDIAGGMEGDHSLTCDEVMDKILFAATELHMPIAWISPYKKDGHWPMFQLRDGKKTEFSYSNQDHMHPKHYHLVLPRPDWAVAVIKY